MGTPTATPLYLLGSPREMKVNTNTDVTMVFGTFTFSSSYASGGESLTPATAGLKEIFFLATSPAYAKIGGTNQYQIVNAVYDITNKKMLAYGASASVASAGAYGMSECVDAKDLSSFTVRYVAVGRKAAS
jgi:hypothetical protein